MNKVYIQVQELLREYGVPFDELLQIVKSGKLALYAMTRPFEYEAIASFDCYVDDWIARERERIEREYNHRQIHYPNERYELIRSLQASIGRYGGEQRNFRVRGQTEIAKDRYKNKLECLADREGVARGLAAGLFVKTSDYETIANSGKSPRHGKREDTEIRIKETLEACQFVEKKYGPLLLNKSKKDVFNLVKAEMNYMEPYRQTFNDWYTACPFTRKAGNPNNRKKSA